MGGATTVGAYHFMAGRERQDACQASVAMEPGAGSSSMSGRGERGGC